MTDDDSGGLPVTEYDVDEILELPAAIEALAHSDDELTILDINTELGEYLLQFTHGTKQFRAWFTVADIAAVFGDIAAPRFIFT